MAREWRREVMSEQGAQFRGDHRRIHKSKLGAAAELEVEETELAVLAEGLCLLANKHFSKGEQKSMQV